MRVRPGAELLEVRHHHPTTPRLRARLVVEKQLIDDATTRGWAREVERHQATHARLEQLLRELGEPSGPSEGGSARPDPASGGR